MDRRAARMSVRVAIPDLVSPSYFPAIAAVELGFLPDATIELIYPVTKTYEQLREGRLDFVGGAAHAVLYAFKDWQSAKLLCALAQRMYWFLVVHQKASFGLMAARALAENKIDGFWANGMAAELAVREGVGVVVLDARREGTPEMKGYTFPALACTESTIRERPQLALAAVKAVAAAQKALKNDPARATAVA